MRQDIVLLCPLRSQSFGLHYNLYLACIRYDYFLLFKKVHQLAVFEKHSFFPE